MDKTVAPAGFDADNFMQSRYMSAINSLIEGYNENNKTQRLKVIYTFVKALLGN